MTVRIDLPNVIGLWISQSIASYVLSDDAGQIMTQDARNIQERVYHDLRPGLIAFFARRVGSISEAEDLVQDVFVRLATSQEQNPQNTQAFVFSIAANLLRDRARRAAVRARFSASVQQEATLYSDPLDPHRVATGREGLITLVHALDELPERTRNIFLLYRYENVRRAAIAESFGISVSAVEKHLHKAMALLVAKVGAEL